MKKLLLTLLCLIGVTAMWGAEKSVEIVFAGGTDNNRPAYTTQTAISDVVTSGADFFSQIASTNKTSPGVGGLKINTNKNTEAEGIVLSFTNPLKITKIVATATAAKNAPAAATLTINGQANTVDRATQTSPIDSDFKEYTFNYTSTEASTQLSMTSVYSTTVKKLVITYEGEEENPDLQAANLKFEPATVTVNMGDAFTAPVFSKDTDATVNFTSSNDAVATVSSTGEIAIAGPGVATITAVSEANATYAAGRATCTVTVTDYKDYKAVSAISAGKPYFFVADGKIAGAITSGYYMPTTDITVADGKISAQSANAFYFEASDTDGQYYLKDSNGKYYYVAAGKTDFNTSADKPDTNGLWTVAIADDKVATITNVGTGNIVKYQSKYSTFSSVAEATEGTQPVIYGEETVTPPVLKPAGLAFAAATAEATMGQAFTAPAFTKATTATVTFTSSTPATATVDAATGEVTLVAAGTTTIMATSEANAEFEAGTAQYVLTVNPAQGGEDPDPEQPKPAGLAFSAATAEAVIGETFTAPVLVKATTAAVTYSSSNNQVAVIDGGSGKIVLLKAGTTIITASAPATTGFLAGTAQYTLTVKAPETPDQPAERKTPVMYFTPGVMQAEIGQAFTEPVLTKDTDAQVFYTSNNTDVAMVDALSGKLTLVAAGNAMITATAPATAAYLPGEAFYMLSVTGQGGDTPNPPTPGDSYVVFDIENAGEWTAQGTGFTQTKTVNGKQFTITTDKGSSNSDLKAPNDNTFAWRVYKSTNFTLASADVDMKNVVITYDDYENGKYISTLTLSDGWTGLLDGTTYTVTSNGLKSITATATEKQVRIKKIVVESGEGGGDDPNPPTPGNGYDTLAEWLAAKPSTNEAVNAPLTAIYQNGKDLFVTQGDAYALVYGDLGGKTFSNGDVIPAGVQGKYDEYNGQPEFVPVVSTIGDATAGTAVAAKAVTPADITVANASRYVRVEGVTIAAGSKDREYTVTVDGQSFTMWNRWNKSVTVTTGSDMDVYGFIGVSTDNDAQVAQLYPVRIEGEGGDDPNPPTPGDEKMVTFNWAEPTTLSDPFDKPANGEGVELDGKTFTAGDITIKLSRGTNNSNAPRVFTSSKGVTELRFYGDNTATVGGNNVTITKIEFVTNYASNYANSTADCGTFADAVWTGSNGEVNFKFVKTDYNPAASAINVYYTVGGGGGDDPNPPTPTESTVDFNWAEPTTLSTPIDKPAAGEGVELDGQTFTAGPISVSLSRGTNNSNAPRIFTSSKGATELRFYGDNTATVTGDNVVVKKIEFVCNYPSNYASSTADCGTFADAVWTGEASTINFKFVKTDYNPACTVMRVTYVTSGAIDAIETTEELPVEYYTLQGLRVSEPQPGTVVIRRQGSEVSKILVK